MPKSKKPIEDEIEESPDTVDPIGQAYETVFSWIEYWATAEEALITLSKEFPASEHLRNALIGRAAVNEMINTLNHQVSSCANGDTGLRKPRTWAAMYPG